MTRSPCWDHSSQRNLTKNLRDNPHRIPLPIPLRIPRRIPRDTPRLLLDRPSFQGEACLPMLNVFVKVISYSSFRNVFHVPYLFSSYYFVFKSFKRQPSINIHEKYLTIDKELSQPRMLVLTQWCLIARYIWLGNK